MAGLNITMPIEALKKRMDELGRTVARSAAAEAVNVSLAQAEVAQGAEMQRVFDRPTPWALGGITHDKASPSSLAGILRVRGKTGTGAAIPAEAFLRAQIEGGPRRFKRYEVALYKAGILPAGYYAVPASDQRTDPYGNMGGGPIRALLRDLTSGLFLQQAKRQRGTRRTRGTEWVVFQPGKGMSPGVWQRTDFGGFGKGLRPVLFFVRRATYRKRYDFHATADTSLRRDLPTQWMRAMQDAAGPGGKL